MPGAAAAQGQFEGIITFKTAAGGGPEQNVQYSVKGTKIRMDMTVGPGMQVYSLFDGDTKTMDMVLPQRNMYMEQSVDAAQAQQNAAPQKKADIQWTGKKETIAGYECEHATITDDTGGQTDVCIAKGLGTFMSMGRGGMGGMRRGGPPQGGGWESHVQGGFPLKVQKGGDVIMEVTSIEKKSLDASLFTIPSGFQKMGMPMGRP
jgi:hypothetical protein